MESRIMYGKNESVYLICYSKNDHEEIAVFMGPDHNVTHKPKKEFDSLFSGTKPTGYITPRTDN